MLSFGAIQESIGSLSEWLSSKVGRMFLNVFQPMQDNSIMGDDTAFEEENKGRRAQLFDLYYLLSSFEWSLSNYY